MRIRKTWLALFAMLVSMLPARVLACSDPGTIFLGSVCTFAGNFCPRNFLPADGRLLPISTNTALFSLLGTNYGGNGRTDFGLPDLRGRSMVNTGRGPGLSDIRQGSKGGTEAITLTQPRLPSHTHTGHVNVSGANGNSDVPNDAVVARLPRNNVYSTGAATATTATGSVTVSSSGGGQSVSIRDPYLAVTVCIATQGIFPSRN